MSAAIDDHTEVLLSPESRLVESRSELRDLFVVPNRQVVEPPKFPRSKLMRALTHPNGMAWLAVGAGGLLLAAKPRLFMRVARALPLGTVAKTLAMRFMTRR